MSDWWRRFALALAVISLSSAARAGLLVEGKLYGLPIRLEAGREPNLVRVVLAHTDWLIDVEHNRVVRQRGSDYQVAPVELPRTLRYELTYWGGKRLTIAGESGGYFVMTLHERPCAEVIAATWTRTLVRPLVQAAEIVQRRLLPRSPAADPDCGAIPFGAFAGRGWPLLASQHEAIVFETIHIDLHHQPDETIFVLP